MSDTGMATLLGCVKKVANAARNGCRKCPSQVRSGAGVWRGTNGQPFGSSVQVGPV